eukprot:11615561-Alexandrium_andersonii.AAC.1
MSASLVGSEMCIRDRYYLLFFCGRKGIACDPEPLGRDCKRVLITAAGPDSDLSEGDDAAPVQVTRQRLRPSGEQELHRRETGGPRTPPLR